MLEARLAVSLNYDLDFQTSRDGDRRCGGAGGCQAKAPSEGARAPGEERGDGLLALAHVLAEQLRALDRQEVQPRLRMSVLLTAMATSPQMARPKGSLKAPCRLSSYSRCSRHDQATASPANRAAAIGHSAVQPHRTAQPPHVN